MTTPAAASPARSDAARRSRPAVGGAAPPRRAPTGLRERNKREKRQRIREAARELFSAHGFETATLRQIAERAGVGLGTLFNYARDKRDLTFLLFNDDLSKLVDEAVAASANETGVLDQVLAIWEPHYRFFAHDPVLCRILLRDMYFYVEGREAQRFHAVNTRLRDHLRAVVAAAQRSQQLGTSASAADIAALLFFVFEGSVRHWMHREKPVARAGLATLRRRLKLQLQAFAPDGRPAAPTDGSQERRGFERRTRSTHQAPGTAPRGKK
jgi:AcrR family transcriptional regulator